MWSCDAMLVLGFAFGMWTFSAIRIVFLAREGLSAALKTLGRAVALSFVIWLLGLVVCNAMKAKPGYAVIAAGLALTVGIEQHPRRARRVPARERRTAIARFEATGQKYDPKVHDIDHIVPFSRGGSHTAENLRVVDRTKNRRRGNRMPGIEDLL